MYTVLLVDRDPRFLRAFERTFEQLAKGSDRSPVGLSIRTAESAQAGFKSLEAEPAQIVILNIESIEPSPARYISDLLAMAPKTAVFLLSAKPNDPRLGVCTSAGALGVFDLPTTRSKIFPIFRAVIARLGVQAGVADPADEAASPLRAAAYSHGMRGDDVVLIVESVEIRGRVYLKDGLIVHAESPPLEGVVALRRMLSEPYATIKTATFVAPAKPTITPGLWEYLFDPETHNEASHQHKHDRPDAPSPRDPSKAKSSVIPLTGPIPRIVDAGSRVGDALLPDMLERVVVCDRQTVLIDSVGTEETETICKLVRLMDKRSRMIAEMAGWKPVGRIECIGREMLSVIRFGDPIQGFAITHDPAWSGAKMSEALGILASGQGGLA